MYNYLLNRESRPKCKDYIGTNVPILSNIVELINSKKFLIGTEYNDVIGLYDYRDEYKSVINHLESVIDNVCYSLVTTKKSNALHELFYDANGEPYSYLLYTNLLLSMIDNPMSNCTELTRGELFTYDNGIYIPVTDNHKNLDMYQGLTYSRHAVGIGNAENVPYTINSFSLSDVMSTDENYNTVVIKVSNPALLPKDQDHIKRYFDLKGYVDLKNPITKDEDFLDRITLYDNNKTLAEFPYFMDGKNYVIKVGNLVDSILDYTSVPIVYFANTLSGEMHTVFRKPKRLTQDGKAYYIIRLPNSTQKITCVCYNEADHSKILKELISSTMKNKLKVVDEPNSYPIYQLKPQFGVNHTLYTTSKDLADKSFGEVKYIYGTPVSISFEKVKSSHWNDIDIRLKQNNDESNSFVKTFKLSKNVYFVSPCVIKKWIDLAMKTIDYNKIYNALPDELIRMITIYVNTRRLQDSNFIGVPLGKPLVIYGNDYYQPTINIKDGRVIIPEVNILTMIESVNGENYVSSSTEDYVQGTFLRYVNSKVEPIKFMDVKIVGIPECFYKEVPSDLSTIDISIESVFSGGDVSTDQSSFVVKLAIGTDKYYIELANGKKYVSEGERMIEFSGEIPSNTTTYSPSDFPGISVKVASNGWALNSKYEGIQDEEIKSIELSIPQRQQRLKIDYKINGQHQDHKKLYVDDFDEDDSPERTNIEYEDRSMSFDQYGKHFRFEYQDDGLWITSPIHEQWISLNNLVVKNESFGFSRGSLSQFPLKIKLEETIDIPMGNDIVMKLTLTKRKDVIRTNYIDDLFYGIIDSAREFCDGTNIVLQYDIPQSGESLAEILQQESFGVKQRELIYSKKAHYDKKSDSVWYPSIIVTNIEQPETLLADQLIFVAKGRCPYFSLVSDGTKYSVSYKDDSSGTVLTSELLDVYKKEYNNAVKILTDDGYEVNNLFRMPSRHVTKKKAGEITDKLRDLGKIIGSEDNYGDNFFEDDYDKIDETNYKYYYYLRHPEDNYEKVLTEEVEMAYEMYKKYRSFINSSSINNEFSIYVTDPVACNGFYNVELVESGKGFRIDYRLLSDSRLPDGFVI